jgi:hypothetical protein
LPLALQLDIFELMYILLSLVDRMPHSLRTLNIRQYWITPQFDEVDPQLLAAFAQRIASLMLAHLHDRHLHLILCPRNLPDGYASHTTVLPGLELTIGIIA